MTPDRFNLPMEERMKLLYENYEQAQVDQILRSVSSDAVTVIAHELSTLRPRNGINPENYSDVYSQEIVYAAIDELAARIKAEARFRVDAIEKLKQAEKEVEKQLD